GGVHWQQIFDGQPVQSIGSLAVAQSDSNIVWAGTGEAWIRSHISVGEGIFKSTDAGKTWTRMGLEKTGRIGRVVVDPGNPDIVLACALGHAYGPQPERGIFRTANGGTTWDRVLFVDENTGCSEIAAGDGVPWKGQATDRGQLWRSDDGGDNWRMVNTDRNVLGRTAYYARMAVSTDNENETYYLNASYSKSIDGGATLVAQQGLEAPGRDHHDMWIDPTNGNRMIAGPEQGVSMAQIPRRHQAE